MLSLVAAGLVLGIWAGLSPGPLFAVLISQTMRFGSREGIKVALAPLVTDPPIILISFFVLARIRNSGLVLGVLSAFGAVYVALMAYESWRSGEGVASKPTSTGTLKKAIITNFLSPHPYIFWLTAGGQITISAWKSSSISAVAFVGCFYVCLVGAKLALAVIVGRSRHFIAGKAYIVIMRALGIILIVFSVLLALNAYRLLSA